MKQLQNGLIHNTAEQINLIWIRIRIKIKQMRINEILMQVLESTPEMKERKIRNMYTEMQEAMAELNQADDNAKIVKQKAYLKAFANVMNQMSSELSAAKSKYEQLNREKLKQEKCLKIAGEIKIFREQCYMLKSKMERIKHLIKEEKCNEDLLERQGQALKVNLEKLKMRRKQDKTACIQLKTFLDEPLSAPGPKFVSSAKNKQRKGENYFREGAIIKASSRPKSGLCCYQDAEGIGRHARSSSRQRRLNSPLMLREM